MPEEHGPVVDSTSWLTGVLEVDKTSSVSWAIAFVITLAIVFLGMWVFVFCICAGVNTFTANLDDYKKGVNEFVDWVAPILPKDAWDVLKKMAQSFIETSLPDLATKVASVLESVGFQALMFMIYFSFWILEPLPVSGPVAQVFKSYLLLKTFVCLLFAGSMSLLLMCLDCKLWNLFFVLTFLLNYIPEVGAILSAMLMVPAILFDGHVPIKRRIMNVAFLAIFGTLIKIITGNVIEIRLYGTKGGQFMRMHPVIILALIMLCEELMGITGMFLAVPTMAVVKYYLVSAEMPGMVVNPLLVFIEGDETGPHKNFVDRQRSTGASSRATSSGSASSLRQSQSTSHGTHGSHQLEEGLIE
ncbi:unnamed protein product, partial [Polarella glacialis]